MDRQPELQGILSGLPGVNKAYYQPPENVYLEYPCIIYKWDQEYVARADNSRYISKRRYALTIIDRDPNSKIPDAVGALPMASFSTFFVKDGLNHFNYTLYF